MKTNQVMIRPMGQFKVEQRTKDGFFNATALLKQWNENSGQQKQMSHYTDNASTQEFITALLKEENLKERNSVLLQTRGKNGGTWMHPIAFLDFAMWLNPAFKVKVIKFVYDQMIAYRNEAGDSYKELAAAVSKIVSKDFMRAAMPKIAEAINYCVFNAHATMIRNQHGDEKKMRELFSFQRKVADLINDGFLTNFNGTMEYLRKKWRELHTPKVMLLPDKT